MDLIVGIQIFLILCGVCIFTFDGARFVIGRMLGAKVEEFSFGFGPELISRQRGETKYSLGPIPFGSFTHFFGANMFDESHYKVPFAYLNLPIWKRFIIASSGFFCNLFIGTVIFIVIFMIGAPTPTMTIKDIHTGSPGLRPGDRILTINGEDVQEWSELVELFQQNKGKELQLTVKRNSQDLLFVFKPGLKKEKNIFGEEIQVVSLGLIPIEVNQRHNPISATIEGLKETGRIIRLTIIATAKILVVNFKSEVRKSELIVPGPGAISKMLGERAKAGFRHLLHAAASLAIVLGVLNLLPFPQMCGGEIVFLALEKCSGRPVLVGRRERIDQVSTFILILILIYIFYQDMARLFNA